MYKMSSTAKRLTEERKITAKKYSDNKIHTTCVYRKCTDEDYVIWAKTIDLQRRSCHRNLCQVAIKSFFKTKYPTKKQVKKTQKKNEPMD